VDFENIFGFEEGNKNNSLNKSDQNKLLLSADEQAKKALHGSKEQGKFSSM